MEIFKSDDFTHEFYTINIKDDKLIITVDHILYNIVIIRNILTGVLTVYNYYYYSIIYKIMIKY